MPELPAAAALTASKIEQDFLSDGAIDELADLWTILDPARVVATTGAWLNRVVEMIGRWRTKSSDQAVVDYNKVRSLVTTELAPFRPSRIPGPDLEQLTQDLLVTGPGTVLQQQKLGKSPEAASQTALVLTSGTVNKAVLGGGRETVLAAVKQDRMAKFGATRIARPDACAFCKMLQANTYSIENAGFSAHDLCRCAAGPVFVIGQPVPDLQRETQELWADSTKGLYGKAALSKFRAVLDGREWQGYTSKPSSRGVVTKVAPDGTTTAWRDGKQLGGKAPRPERKSRVAENGAAVPLDSDLKRQYQAEHKALSATVGSTKTDAARQYQTERIAQLERMISLL